MTKMKKLPLLFLLIITLLAGCSSGSKNAAGHLGEPQAIFIQAEGYSPVLISKKAEVRSVMKVLKGIKVRPLSVEEELNLVLKEGKTLNAIDLRFKDIHGDSYKALLLEDGSLLVVDGKRGEKETRRNVYLSLPNQEELRKLIAEHLNQKGRQ